MEYMPDSGAMNRAMAELCNWIGNSRLSYLFGFTSLHTLIVTQVEVEHPIHLSIQYLSIEPDFKTKEIKFQFVDTHLEDRQWSRIETADGSRLISRLVGFVKQSGWAYDVPVYTTKI